MRRQSRLEPVGGIFDGTFKVVTFWAANLHVTGRVMTCHEVSTKLTSSCRKKVAEASHNVSVFSHSLTNADSLEPASP